jgi:hypothetical protein
MKKIAICLMMTCLSFTLLPLQSNAATTDKPASPVATKPPQPVESAEINALLKRVDQFSSTNDSKLIPKENKNSQIEVRTNERHHRNGGVVYVSVGAVILIVILVLVLL